MSPTLKCVTILLLLSVRSANAALVTFGGLSGDTGDAFVTPYSESGFQVTPVTGRWLMGQVGGKVAGNPQPVVYGDTYTASLEIEEMTGGLFTFSGIDIGNTFFDGLATNPVNYTIEGLLGGVVLFSTTGDVTAFTTIVSSSAVEIDTLRLSMVRLEADGYAIDNIRLNGPAAVPEPASILVWGLFGAASMCAMRFHRRTRRQICSG